MQHSKVPLVASFGLDALPGASGGRNMDRRFPRLNPFLALLVLLTLLPSPAAAQRVAIRGRVVNEKGEPVTAARLQVLGTDVSRDLRIATSKNGDFFLMVPLGEYRIVCRAPGYLPDFVEGLKALGDREFIEVNFRLKPGEDRKLPFEITKEVILRPQEASPDSFIIVGFSHQQNELEVSTKLEGVVLQKVVVVGTSTQTVTEYLSLLDGVISQRVIFASDSSSQTEEVLTPRAGLRGRRIYDQTNPVKRAFYSFPVSSGTINLSGFVETVRPLRTYEFNKFVYSYEIPKGMAVYIGSFHLGTLVPKEPVQVGVYPLRQIVGDSQVTVRFDKEAYGRMRIDLKEIDGYEIEISPSIKTN